MVSWIRLLRPHQYVKNLFVFLGVLFSHQWDLVSIGEAGLIFIAFCFVASSVYIMNDIVDIESDRKHPVKTLRPLPNGDLSIKNAMFILCFCLLMAILISLYVSLIAILLIGLYFLVNVGYTLYLKNIVIIDVFCISVGFIIRILIGTLGLGIIPSIWIVLCGFMVTLFLGFSKRLAEILSFNFTLEKEGRIHSRMVLNLYTEDLLKQFVTIMATGTIISYGLYITSVEFLYFYKEVLFALTIPLVVYGVLRYLYLVYKKVGGEDTAKDLIKDKSLLWVVIIWFVMIILALK